MLESALTSPAADAGSVPDLGEGFSVIADADGLRPFLMSIISSGDVWLFIASNGALTAGRRNPDHALFPYYTDDLLLDQAHTTGGVTLVRGSVDGRPFVWHPGSPDAALPDAAPRRRWLAKSRLGDEVVFGEDRPDLGLAYRVSWTTGRRFGLVRRATITNTADQAVDLELLDGVRNLLPAGVTRQTQNELSNLLDAYKRSEIDPATGLGVYSLSSGLTDLAEPAESLHATVAWGSAAAAPVRLATDRALAAFARGATPTDDTDARGVRGAYLGVHRLHLEPGQETTLTTVADTGLDSAAVADLAAALADPDALAQALADDLAQTRAKLGAILAGADARQLTDDHQATAHHLACVAFNAMRGGVPIDGYRVHPEHLRAFLSQRAGTTAARFNAFLDALPADLTVDELVAAGRDSGDPDLERLTLEFLPLTFGRRHGDPSRPWNRFDIAITDAAGEPVLGYQGNWRDIFQNWEALAWSYPSLVEPMIATFVDATTADGYNPYRITHRGVDWEVPEPENPWANIGYWGDHQITYLTRLLAVSQRFHPGRLDALLDRPIFTSADVPYRIAPFAEIVADPVNTITFDADADARARARAATRGGDGLLRTGADGVLERVTLADKLLNLLAAKLVNLVPGGGIWMNTQRPEWNDANNALVGHGVSIVTMAQVLEYVDLVGGLLGGRDVELRAELADLLDALAAALASTPAGPVDDAARRVLMQALGEAGERYRAAVYAGTSTATRTHPAARAASLLASARAWLVAGLDASRRPDGPFHSYRTLSLTDAAATLHDLPLMLEGQVAVIQSGHLSADATLDLLGRLRTSPLYRADQHSYLLYPDRDLPGFLGRNQLARQRLAGCASVDALLGDPRRPVFVADAAGALHFAEGLGNARVLAERLDALAREPRHAGLTADKPAILAAYEETFNHREFTGRSGSFFAYEGLGSIYWHMVSKLAVGVRGALDRARSAGDAAAPALQDAYDDVVAGLGTHKTPQAYGAFPADPYSHTPRHAGARQPGMTGQVKEDILNRFGELGVSVADGRVRLDPDAVADREWTPAPAEFAWLDGAGVERTVGVPAGAVAFTLCQVPFVVERDASGHEVRFADGSVRSFPGTTLDADVSAAVFGRRGEVMAVRMGY